MAEGPLHVAQRYFDAWNRHDAAGIVAIFAEGGTYADPATAGPLSGESIGVYVRGLCPSNSDLHPSAFSFPVKVFGPAAFAAAAHTRKAVSVKTMLFMLPPG